MAKKGEATKKNDEFGDSFWFVVCVVGIFVSYFIFGILQEEVTTERFGKEKERLNNAQFLVFVQCVANVIVAWAIIVLFSSSKDNTPFMEYLPISTTYVGAMFCSNAAVEYIDFPTMVLGKSCKPIPVMIMGVFVLGKQQTLLKYVSVFMISVGIAIFSYKVGAKSDSETSLIGLLLLTPSLAMDGVTGPFQEKLLRKYNPSSYHMMIYINLWASIILGATLAITGDGIKAIEFCSRHPEVMRQLLTLSVAGAIGQNFIYFTISKFGSLACSLITTTRKFFTILGSVVWFGHSLNQMQWLGVFVVFAGLGVDMLNSGSKQKQH